MLETEYNQLITDAEEVSNTDAGESAEAQVKERWKKRKQEAANACGLYFNN